MLPMAWPLASLPSVPWVHMLLRDCPCLEDLNLRKGSLLLPLKDLAVSSPKLRRLVDVVRDPDHDLFTLSSS